MAWRGTPDEAVVDSAADMIAAQLGCTSETAIVKLRERAEDLSRTVPDAARLVIGGVIRFEP